MKTYVAIQRKLLILVYTLWKKDMAYDPNFVWTGKAETGNGGNQPVRYSIIASSEGRRNVELE